MFTEEHGIRTSPGQPHSDGAESISSVGRPPFPRQNCTLDFGEEASFQQREDVRSWWVYEKRISFEFELVLTGV
jgi:hypothetical protein